MYRLAIEPSNIYEGRCIVYLEIMTGYGWHLVNHRYHTERFLRVFSARMPILEMIRKEMVEDYEQGYSRTSSAKRERALAPSCAFRRPSPTGA